MDTWSLCLSNIVYDFTVFPMSMFAYVASFIFDVGLQVTLSSITYSQDFVTQGWTTVRDIANMAFIFMLVYLAIIIVLRADTSNTMRMLAAVIIVALLINFSFFFSRLVIDGGNLLAVQFYNAISVQTLKTTAQGTAAASHLPAVMANTKDLTYNIMQLIGVQTLLSSDSFAVAFQKQPEHGFFTNFAIFSFIYIVVAIILAILTFVFISVGIKFLYRVVILWMLIVVAPLAFVAGALNDSKGINTRGLFKQWMSLLVGYAFYPAVFLFMYVLINLFCAQMGSQQGGLLSSSLKDANLSTGDGIGGFLIPLAVAIASISIRLGLLVLLLMLTMKAADAVMKKSGSFANAAATTATNWSANKMIGATGSFGRNTFGRAGERFAQSSVGQKMAASNAIGRSLYRVADKAGRSSWDVRGVSGLSKTVDTVVGTKLSAAPKKSFAASAEERVKQKVAFSEKLKPNAATLDKAHKQAVAEFPKERKEELRQLHESYKDAEQKFADKQISKKEFDQIKTKYETELRKAGKEVDEKARTLAGAKNPKIFGDALDSRRLANLGGILSSGIPGFIGAEDRRAAAIIRGRGQKEPNAILRDEIEGLKKKKEEEKTVPPPTPTTPPPTTPTTRPPLHDIPNGGTPEGSTDTNAHPNPSGDNSPDSTPPGGGRRGRQRRKAPKTMVQRSLYTRPQEEEGTTTNTATSSSRLRSLVEKNKLTDHAPASESAHIPLHENVSGAEKQALANAAQTAQTTQEHLSSLVSQTADLATAVKASGKDTVAELRKVNEGVGQMRDVLGRRSDNSTSTTKLDLSGVSSAVNQQLKEMTSSLAAANENTISALDTLKSAHELEDRTTSPVALPQKGATIIQFPGTPQNQNNTGEPSPRPTPETDKRKAA